MKQDKLRAKNTKWKKGKPGEETELSNISTTHSNIGSIATLCLHLSVPLPWANSAKVNQLHPSFCLLMVRRRRPSHKDVWPLVRGQSFLLFGLRRSAARYLGKTCRSFGSMINFLIV